MYTNQYAFLTLSLKQSKLSIVDFKYVLWLFIMFYFSDNIELACWFLEIWLY